MANAVKKLEFRTLKADEIDCRVGNVTDKGVSLLLYKDARVDMRLLDEVVGTMNWKREHEIINGNLYCTVSIYNEATQQWVSKQDVGVESNTEKEKGQASDAFKRACFNWGIGRELYTSPFVWINLSQNEWRFGVGGKKQPAVKFYVKEIGYKDNKVSKLIIVDDKGVERYTFGVGRKAQQPAAAPQAQGNNPNLTYDDQLGAAVLDAEACKSEEELKSLYFAYKAQFGNDQRFLDALSKRKAELQAA
jgi:hypothetical protein